MKKFLLVDGNLFLFRSFYAAQAISKDSKNMTSHLFFNSIFEIIREKKPEYIFFAFDAFGPTKRHQEFQDYKAGRIKAPEELYQQKSIIIDLLKAMNLFSYSQVGDEADDLIATVCEKYKQDNEILILSEDRDLLQLVDKNVSIIQKNRNKQLNQKYIDINVDNFYEIFQFHPNQVVDYKGIAGDSSDNLIGIKGIGPKTTIDLLKNYQNLEGIYQNLDQLKEKQKNAFLENKEHAFLCKRLATLNKNVDFDFDLNKLLFNVQSFESEQLKELLKKYNLRKILSIIENWK